MNQVSIPVGASKRARSKAANRRSILEAGRRVFARIGYEATTVRDIIRETDLASGTFYNYFKSKEEVFQAIAEDSTHRFRGHLRDVREHATTFEAYVHEAYEAYFSFIYAENERAIAEGAPHMALIGVRVDTPEMLAISEEIRSDLEHILADGNAPDIDTNYLTSAAIGIARQLGDHMLMRRPIDVDSTAQFAAKLLIAGVRELAAK